MIHCILPGILKCLLNNYIFIFLSMPEFLADDNLYVKNHKFLIKLIMNYMIFIMQNVFLHVII